MRSKEIIQRNKLTVRIRNNRGKIQRILPIQKVFYGLANVPTKPHEKIDRTIEFSTPARSDNKIVVNRGRKQDHEKKII